MSMSPETPSPEITRPRAGRWRQSQEVQALFEPKEASGGRGEKELGAAK